MMKGTYERNNTDLRKEKPNFRASDRFAGAMDPAAQGAAEEGEGAHAAPGPIKRGTPLVALGASGKELLLRSSWRKGIINGPLRRTQPTGHLSLYVRTGLEGGLPELLFRVRPYRRRARAPGGTRRHDGDGLTGAAGQDRGVQEAHGLAVCMGVVIRQQFQP
jgi:hypothetical protein